MSDGEEAETSALFEVLILILLVVISTIMAVMFRDYIVEILEWFFSTLIS